MNPGVAVTKSATQTGHNLLMRWCAVTATAPNAIEHPFFQACVAFVSNQCHKALTRHCLMLALTRLVDHVRSSMTYQLKKRAYLGVQMDGWSSGGRHLVALCISVPGEQFFANAYENWREDTAANSAVAVNACLSDLLEVSPGPRRPLQQGKVAGVTSDTTNVMPATVRELSQMSLFKGCIWVPCGCHVMISYLLGQVKQVQAIKQLLALAKGIVDVFRIQAFRKIFLRHALPAEHSLALRATTSAPSGCISRAFVFPS
jgi:hypothetical protein